MINNWIHDAIFYHLYPLGICGGPHQADSNEPVVNRLEALHQWLPHIKSLGANTLLLGPVFASESHGYDTRDYFRIDPRLGSNDDFVAFCNAARELGFRIVLDGVFNHVGRSFPRFIQLLEEGCGSSAAAWFHNVDFGGESPYGDPFSYEGWNGHHSLVKLNLENPEVKGLLFDAVRFWMDEFGIDGLRLDAADSLPGWFFKELAGVCKEKRPDFWLMGEVIHGDYRDWTEPGKLNATTNYECYKGLFSSHNDHNYHEIAWSLNRLFGPEGVYRHLHLYNFADNHDVTRIGSVLTEYRHIHPLHILLFTMPGAPSLYYGSEWGIPGVKDNGDDWHLRPRLTPEGGRSSGDTELEETIRNLIRIRQEIGALKTGSYRQLAVGVDGKMLAFCRENGDGAAVVVVNSGDSGCDFPLQDYFPGKRFRDRLNGDAAYQSGSSVPVAPAWGCVLEMC